MPPVESTLTVRFPVPRIESSNFISWSIESAYLTSTDGFQFEIYSPVFTSKHRLEMQPVELLVNGASQLIGRIDKTRSGHNGRAVACFGRDYLADTVENNVDPKFKLRLKMTIGDLISQVFHPTGISRIFDVDDGSILMQEVRAGIPVKAKGGRKRAPRKPRKGKPTGESTPKPGAGAYEYVNKIIARVGATMQPGPDRNSVVLSVPDYDQESIGTLRRSDDPIGSVSNNVVESVADRDFSRMPTYALFNGVEVKKKGTAASPLSKTLDIFELAARSPELLQIIADGSISGRWLPGETADQVRTEGKLYRLLNFRDDTARTLEQLECAADRAVAERLKDSLQYECTVRGHADERTGAIWSVNTMVRVEDDIANVHEDLWVAARTLSYEKGNGARTRLICWRPDSFVIDGSLDGE